MPHEFTHAVIDYTAKLQYIDQSGALTESIADIFGAVISNTWLHAANRSLIDPTQYGHPDHMKGYLNHGSVHFNSNIHNKAAYLLSEGGVHPKSKVYVHGIGSEKVAKLYYHALTHYLKPNSNFNNMREDAIKSAEDLHFTASEIQSVRFAYLAVGIK